MGGSSLTASEVFDALARDWTCGTQALRAWARAQVERNTQAI
jgi:hypothetical protein